jgi:hypothetical protein
MVSSGRWQCHFLPIVGFDYDTAGLLQGGVNIDTTNRGYPTFTRLLVPLKWISIKKLYIGKLYYLFEICAKHKTASLNQEPKT